MFKQFQNFKIQSLQYFSTVNALKNMNFAIYLRKFKPDA